MTSTIEFLIGRDDTYLPYRIGIKRRKGLNHQLYFSFCIGIFRQCIYYTSISHSYETSSLEEWHSFDLISQYNEICPAAFVLVELI